METKLIYVNKDGAAVRNEETGEFISETPSIICKAGDLLSIESIAVSTDGTGADTIEIPKVVRNYNYATNEILYEFMFYIHNNFKYAGQLPFHGTEIFLNQSEINYGDIKPSVYVINSNNDYYCENASFTDFYGGTRFWLGSWGNDGDDPIIPYSVNTSDQDQSLGTGNLVYNFLTTKIPTKLDYGYNTPENITSKVTYDLHNSAFTPNRFTIDEEPENYYQPNLSNSVGGGTQQLQATATSKNSSVMTIWATLRNYFSSSIGGYYGNYSNLIATKMPFYWYWGSRLQATLPNGTLKENAWLTSTYAGSNYTQQDIVALNAFKQTAGRTYFVKGDAIVTNIPYTEENIIKVKNLLYAMKIYNNKTGKTREEMKQDKSAFTSKILFGKYNDGAALPYFNSVQLFDKRGSGSLSCIPTNTYTQTFYDESLVDLLFMPVLQSGITIIKNEPLILADGTYLQDNKSVCKYFDVNIGRARLLPSASGKDVICLISNEAPILPNLPSDIIPGGSFVLFDSSFTRDESHSMIMATTDLRADGNKHTLSDIVRGINVGAPNIQLLFNGDRSRFGWANMYWSQYIGNEEGGTDENPAASTEVIAVNRVNKLYFRKASQDIVYTTTAQSGLGFYKIYVKDTDGNWVYIDPKNQNDIDTKYKNCYLERIGFDITDLIDDFGLPTALYQERMEFGNEPIEYPQYFPYPLTCSPEVDTAFNISINATTAGFPTFNLSLEKNNTGINVAAQSAEILARNKPEKLSTPYWLIESDLIPAIKYYVDGKPRNIMAVCNRAYGSGDFVFSFSSDYKFINTKEFVISCIKTNILTSDLVPAIVDGNTTIIYKIESPIIPNFVSAQQQQELEMEEEAKKK
jgi:hypothetical protein